MMVKGLNRASMRSPFFLRICVPRHQPRGGNRPDLGQQDRSRRVPIIFNSWPESRICIASLPKQRKLYDHR